MLIYNTASGRKEIFEPAALPVKMYVCGLTPKNDPHLGHARLFVVNDTVRRYLEYRDYPVNYVQNFTDVDDKIIKAGEREGVTAAEAAQRYTSSYFRDMDALDVRRADTFTYVTAFVPRIVEMVQGLIARGHAYELDGDVYFSVPSFPAYGRLSGRDEEAMQAGARIEPNERKHDPRDFALWKAAKPGEPAWESPWGPGRPGWHIECSTMVLQTLGEQIDIHGGGTDLIFPHHENEIAQSESYTDRAPFVRYWVHTGMLNVPDPEASESVAASVAEGATRPHLKMAHSGSFIPIRAVLDTGQVPAPALRTYLLGQHYRANLTYSEEHLLGTVARWRRWAETHATVARLVEAAEADTTAGTPGPRERTLEEQLTGARADFVEAMDDDFNTSAALATLDKLVHRINEYRAGLAGAVPSAAEGAALRAGLATLEELAGTLGIALEVPEDAVPRLTAEQETTVAELIAERDVARKAKNWAEADRIRQALDERFGVLVKDTPQGATWSLKEL